MIALRRTALLLTLGLALLAATPAFALTSFTDVEKEVMCDTCNVALNVAESPRADQIRKQIRVLIGQGRSKAQIKTELKAIYGPKILALPPRSGFSLAAYLVPILVALGLLALVVVLIPRWRRRGPPLDEDLADAAPALTPADQRRLDDELARFGA